MTGASGANAIFRAERRSCRAPREISRSPRLAHKAPVMQVTEMLKNDDGDAEDDALYIC